jgi:ribosomal protein S18 acetylase RimI-like enzyme
VPIEIKLLARGDERVLANVAPDVFDRGIDARLTSEFLNEPRHHLAVAIDDGVVVGFVSAVDYLHPDKPRELWINEIAVASTHRNRGVGKQLLRAMLDLAHTRGCREAWVLTDRSNAPAMRLYTSLGGTEAPRDQVMFTFKL